MAQRTCRHAHIREGSCVCKCVCEVDIDSSGKCWYISHLHSHNLNSHILSTARPATVTNAFGDDEWGEMEEVDAYPLSAPSTHPPAGPVNGTCPGYPQGGAGPTIVAQRAKDGTDHP